MSHRTCNVDNLSVRADAEQDLVRRIGELADQIARALGQAGSSADQAVVAAEEHLDDLGGAGPADARGGAATARITRMLAKLDSIAISLAPGALSRPLRSAAADGDSPPDPLAVPPAVRIGSVPLESPAAPDGSDVPLLVPLLEQGNFVVTGRNATARPATQMLLSMILRSLAGCAPGLVTVTVYDPTLSGGFAPLALLRHHADNLVEPTASTPEQLRRVLETASQQVMRVTDQLGPRYSSLSDLHHAVGQQIEAYRLLVLLHYPEAVTAEDHRALVRIAQAGPRCGVSLLVHNNTDLTAHRNVAPTDLLGVSTYAYKGKDSWRFVSGPTELSFVPDTLPPTPVVETLSARLGRAAKTAAAPSLPLADTLPPPEQSWSASSAAGLRAPIGRAGRDLVEISLGDHHDNVHNVLVGGSVGSGKSNVLLTLVYGLAARYGPDELEMHLLDLKDGLVFSQFAHTSANKHWLPHAKVVGIRSDREFAVAVLEDLVDSLTQRAQLIKAALKHDLQGFREARPDEAMRRVLVVIDEFQVLFADRSGEVDELARKAIAHLETLARTGRAYGYHLVLATQTISGVRALALKSDAIFGQFAARIALKMSASDSRTMLAADNFEAAQLRYRGEAVLNLEHGRADANRRLMVLHAQDAALAELRRRWCAWLPDRPPPLAVEPNLPAELTCSRSWPGLVGGTWRAPEGQVAAWLAEALTPSRTVLASPVDDERGTHVALVGDGVQEAIGALHAASLSLAIQHARQPARFYLVNLLRGDSADAVRPSSLAAAIGRLGSTASLVDGRGFARLIVDLARPLAHPDQAGKAGPTYVVVFGMHRASGLDERVQTDPANPIAVVTVSQEFQRLVKHGSMHGVHLLAWWANMAALAEHLTFGRKDINSWLFLRAQRDAVVDVLGPFAGEWYPRPWRALFFDRTFSADGTLVVPFRPLTEGELAAVGTP